MLLSFEQYNNQIDIGKKAHSLVMLKKMGVAVPAGNVIPSYVLRQFLDDNKISQFVKQLTRYVNDKYMLLQIASTIRAKILQADLPQQLETDVNLLTKEHPHWRYAIRSSGSCEDLPEASFAGMYNSYLNINTTKIILEKVKLCWASLFSRRVILYCLEKGISIDRLAMSVIIQRMIPATKVVFCLV